jgi:hypothetical protein
LPDVITAHHAHISQPPLTGQRLRRADFAILERAFELIEFQVQTEVIADKPAESHRPPHVVGAHIAVAIQIHRAGLAGDVPWLGFICRQVACAQGQTHGGQSQKEFSSFHVTPLLQSITVQKCCQKKGRARISIDMIRDLLGFVNKVLKIN